MLIHYIENIRPGGGPRGYLYNLNESVQQFDSSFVKVVSESNDSSRSAAASKPYTVFDIILKLAYFMVVGYSKRYRITEEKLSVLKQADIVVFHRSAHLNAYLKQNPGAKEQKIALMPHNPMSPAEESIELLCQKIPNPFKFLKNALLKVTLAQEIKIFEQADFLITPNSTACDGYYEKDEQLKKRFTNLNFYHIETGVTVASSKKEALEMRENFGYTTSDNLVGFFGRLESVKGYNIFLQMAKTHRNKKFISAGIGSLLGESGEVKELGWRTDVFDLINMVDIVLVPNKVAYFDLIILECLSLGKTVVTSNVGGSRMLNIDGVITYDNIDELNDIISRPVSEICVPVEKVKEEFIKRFSLRSFLKSYEELEGKVREEKI